MSVTLTIVCRAEGGCHEAWVSVFRGHGSGRGYDIVEPDKHDRRLTLPSTLEPSGSMIFIRMWRR
jgi:hypothetical protein